VTLQCKSFEVGLQWCYTSNMTRDDAGPLFQGDTGYTLYELNGMLLLAHPPSSLSQPHPPGPAQACRSLPALAKPSCLHLTPWSLPGDSCAAARLGRCRQHLPSSPPPQPVTLPCHPTLPPYLAFCRAILLLISSFFFLHCI